MKMAFEKLPKGEDAGAAGGERASVKLPKRRHVATGRRRGGRLTANGERQHLYSPEVAEEICNRVSTGRSLLDVCRDPDIGVEEAAVRQWAYFDVDGFASKYAGARMRQVEAWSDQLIQIADNDLLEPNDRRVRIDTRRWLMSKLHPAKYGDRVTLAGDAENPLQHVVSVLDMTKLSDPELDAFERFADARLAAIEEVENSKGSDEQS
jgi:hypothetical protein